MNQRNRYYADYPQFSNHNGHTFYSQKPYGYGSHQPYYNHKPGYYSNRKSEDAYYHQSNNKAGMLYLLLILGFIAYGISHLDENYGKKFDGGANQSTLVDLNSAPSLRELAEDYDTKNIAPPEEDTEPRIVDSIPLAYFQETAFGDGESGDKDTVFVIIPNDNRRYFYTQVGAYQNFDNASKHVVQITNKGFKASVVQLDKHAELYQVVVGAFSTIEEAKAYNHKAGRVFEWFDGKFYAL